MCAITKVSHTEFKQSPVKGADSIKTESTHHHHHHHQDSDKAPEEFVPEEIEVPFRTFHNVMAVVNHLITGYLFTIFGPFLLICLAIYLDWRMFFTYFNPLYFLGVYVTIIFKIMICMSACLHRYFSHNAFKAGRVTSVFLGVIACLAGQRGPLWWASKHGRHHKHCDNEKDPHSPQRSSKIYAYLLWTGAPSEVFTDYAYIPKHHITPELILVDSFCSVFPMIEWYLMYRFFGTFVMFLSMSSTVYCCLATLAFNVIFHWVHEDQTIQKFSDGTYKCAANDRVPGIFRNVLGFSGEYSHEDHHVNPNRAKRPTHLIDLPYWLFIKPGHMLGLFSQINMGEGVKLD